MAGHPTENLHHTSEGKRQARALIGGLAILLVLASGVSAQEAPGSQDPSTGLKVDLLEIPQPDMESLEEAVREQLTTAYQHLQFRLRQESPPVAEVAAAFGRVGRLLHAYELWESAAASYTNASNLEPESFEWTYLLGYVYQRRGDFAAAAASYRRALELDPEDLSARVHLGEVEKSRNKLDEAAAELHRALELAPGNPAARAVLGDIALARGAHQEAVEMLEGVLTVVPEANRLHYPLGMAYRGLGELDKAREHLGKVGKVGLTVADPLVDELTRLATGERVYLLRGRQAFAAARYEEAAAEFRRALEADPESARVRVNLGSALGQTGDVVGAMEQYEAALAIDPGNFTAHFNLGAIKVGLKDDEGAVGHYRDAINHRYTDGEAHHQLGLALRRLGRAEEALKHLREAWTMDPGNESARLDEVVALVDLGRYKIALERLEEAHVQVPSSGGIAHALARLLAGSPDASLRDGERALDLARRVHDALPTPGHKATVAMAFAELGRCEEAADWQGTAVQDATERGAADAAQRLRQALARYEAGAPCN